MRPKASVNADRDRRGPFGGDAEDVDELAAHKLRVRDEMLGFPNGSLHSVLEVTDTLPGMEIGIVEHGKVVDGDDASAVILLEDIVGLVIEIASRGIALARQGVAHELATCELCETQLTQDTRSVRVRPIEPPGNARPWTRLTVRKVNHAVNVWVALQPLGQVQRIATDSGQRRG
jgi:hypothetical protein